MRKKEFSKKLLSMALAGSLVVGMTSTLSGCGSKKRYGHIRCLQYACKLFRYPVRMGRRPFKTEVQCQVKLCTV